MYMCVHVYVYVFICARRHRSETSVCCSVLQCVHMILESLMGGHCRFYTLLQCVAVRCSAVQCVAVCCSAHMWFLSLWWEVTAGSIHCCSALHCVAVLMYTSVVFNWKVIEGCVYGFLCVHEFYGFPAFPFRLSYPRENRFFPRETQLFSLHATHKTWRNNVLGDGKRASRDMFLDFSWWFFC